MPYVRSSESYNTFIEGRDTESSVHREDGSVGECCGWVESDDVRVTDSILTRTAYSTLVQSIQTYNDSLPNPIEPPTSKEEYAALANDVDRVVFLAKRLGLIDT